MVIKKYQSFERKIDFKKDGSIVLRGNYKTLSDPLRMESLKSLGEMAVMI